MKRGLLVAIMAAGALVWPSRTAAQQQLPALERGLQPEKLYHFNDIDNVNVFNGNLSITLPIGLRYPLDGGLSYQLTLSYNSNLWDYVRSSPIGGGETYIRATPARRSNAGIGWIVGFGDFLPLGDAANNSFEDVYAAPDGGEHRFDLSKGEPFVKYTNDGTNLRLRTFTSPASVAEIDFPDGTVQRHEKDSSGVWELREIRAPRGNAKVTLTRLSARPAECGTQTDAWRRVSDGIRNHYLCYKTVPMDFEDKLLIDSIVLDGPQDQWPTYRFQYETVADIFAVAGERPPENSSTWPQYHIATLLKTVVLPDDSLYHFEHRDESADLVSLTLPTGGRIEYAYQLFGVPSACICTFGYNQLHTNADDAATVVNAVITRTVRPAVPVGATPEAFTWTYSRTKRWIGPPTYCIGPGGYLNEVDDGLVDEIVATITDPFGLRVDSHFSTWPADMAHDSPNGFKSIYYSFPYGRYDTPQDRFLSQEHYQCSGTNCTKLRSTHVRHDLELRSTPIPTMPNAAMPWHRLASHRVAYHDDPSGCTADGAAANCKATVTESSDWDGYGHYRTTTVSHNFGSGGSRSATKDWNTVNGLPRVIAPAQAWHLNEYENATAQEHSNTATQQACFDTVNGIRFLRATRSLKSQTPGANDLIGLYGVDVSGNVTSEKYFGGEATPLPSAAATATSLCNALTFLAAPAYDITNSWLYGVLATSQHSGTTHLSRDLSIDRSGLVSESRDSAGVPTKYSYDRSGRITKIEPAGSNPVTYSYTNVQIGTNLPSFWLIYPATATRTRSSVSGDHQLVYDFDSLGRVWHEKGRMPGGKWSLRETLHDGLGRTRRISEWTDVVAGTNDLLFSPPYATAFTGFDSFGRVGTVTSSDGSTTQFSYSGDRLKTKTVRVATSTTNSSYVTTTEHYDGFGRLVKVIEPAGASSAASPIGGDVTTEYTYDEGNRLATVHMTGDGMAQDRSFDYDGRGLLLSETHPESGTTRYTYDARGKVGTRADGAAQVKYLYDSAERLWQVFHVVGAVDKAIKEFSYATVNDGNNKRKGKLETAIRRNELPSGSTIDVTETYEYAGPGGQLSKRTTAVDQVTSGAPVRIQEFVYTVPAYDEFLMPKTVGMPTCTSQGCTTTNGLPSVDYVRDAGYLTSVGSFASLGYHPSGMVHTVKHFPHNGEDKYEAEYGLARPSRITLPGTPASSCSTPVMTAPDSVCPSSNNDASVAAPGATSYSWTISGGTFSSPTNGTSVTFQPNGSSGTLTLTVSVTTACGPRESSKTINIGSMGASQISAPASVCASSTGNQASVPARPGVVHTWLISGGTITSGQTGDAVTFSVGSSSVVTLTVTATSACGSSPSSAEVIIAPPPTATVAPNAVLDADNQYAIHAALTGIGPWAVTWSDGVTQTSSLSPALRHVKPATLTTYSITKVTGAFGCSGTSTGSVNVPGAPPTSNPTQRVYAYQKMSSLYAPGHTAQLFIIMDPPQQESVHEYKFEWYEDDGTGTLTKLNGDGSEILVQTESISIFWAKITGTHSLPGFTSYVEITNSPHMYVYLESACELPALRVEQTATLVVAGTPLTFTAVCDWPGVDFQWYVGQSGDTRHPIAADANDPSRLTVQSDNVRPYWVRASRDCGATEDSPTLTFETSSCRPVLIERQPESRTVAWGGDVTLSVNATTHGSPSFAWYEGAGQTSPVGGNSMFLPLQDVKKSARYWVKVSSPECGNSADSYLATVRVASCPTITPPAQWQTEVWTDLNAPATLSVSAGGATGYQWFRGELGDESGLIPNGTLSTYVTENLAQEAQYWVRVFGSGGCIVDSPTITVKLCEKPRLISAPSLNNNIVPGQWASFSVNMAGTDLQYRWYEGLPGDTTTPVGMPIDLLRVRPLQTTRYWVSVTARCGTSGSNPRPWDPAPDPIPVFTASMCPVLSAPTAAKTVVMPNATTTLSIQAQGTELTYQWYIGSPGDTTRPVVNGNTATITTPSITENTTFWCEVKSGFCPRQSEAVVVALCELPSIGWSPQNRDKVEKSYFQFLRLHGVPTEEPVTYAWYEGQAGDVSRFITSQPAPGISPAQTTTYWARVTMENTGCHVDVPPFTVQVCIPTITTQPAPSSTLDKTTNPSASVRLTVVADLPEAAYQWYIGEPGNITAPITGATASFYDASPNSDTTYWARVAGTCEISRDSTAATVILCQAPVITHHPSGKITPAGFTSEIEVIATGTELSYRWYKGITGDTSTPIGSSRELVVTPTETTDYWVRVTGLCGVVDSNTAKLSIPPGITTQPAGAAITSGTTRTLSVAASGAQLAYKWYRRSGSTDVEIAGATGTSYTTPPITADTTYFCRVFSGAAHRDSDLAALTVCQPRTISVAPWTSVSGAQTTLSIDAAAPGQETYEWYRGLTGDTSALVGTGTTKTINPLETTYYWARTKRPGCDADSAALRVDVCYPKVITQPQSSTTAAGTQKTLTVAATGTPPLAYQWYIGPKGSTTNPVAGATGFSYTTPALTATTTYWALVTSSQQGACGTRNDVSEAATITVCNPPQISSVSSTQFIQSGSSASIKVIASGTNLTYQWYTGATGVTTTPVTGGTTSAISVSPTATKTYWVQIKSEGLCVTNSATVTVDVCTTPAITTQPLSQTIRTGQPATLSVATTATGATYHWYQGAPGTLTTPLGTTASITVSPGADAQYWVRITRGACSADSSGATITVCNLTASVANVNAASGQNAMLTATVTNGRGPLTYTWYRGSSGDTSVLTGVGSQISVARTATTNYWVRVSDGTCTIDSATATLNICIPTITAQPQSGLVTSGQSKTLSVTATGSPLTYQWYAGDSGVTTSPIAGATSPSYTTPALTVETKYWVRVTGCSAVNSATATVTVCIPPNAPTPTISGAYTPGGSASVAIAATGTALTYQWYKGQSGDTTRPISGATGTTYTFTAQASEYYWVRVTGTCGTVHSPAKLHSVVPVITTQPQSIAVPEGSSATLSVAATGNFLTYQWFAGSSPVAGATAATFVTPPVTAQATYSVKVSSGTVYRLSNEAVVSICTGPGVMLTANSLGSHSWNLVMNFWNEEDRGNVEYQWYIGTPGNPAQSTPQGGITSIYYKTVTVTETQTWWVRAWYLDHSCYTDTLGRTIN